MEEKKETREPQVLIYLSEYNDLQKTIELLKDKIKESNSTIDKSLFIPIEEADNILNEYINAISSGSKWSFPLITEDYLVVQDNMRGKFSIKYHPQKLKHDR